MEMRCDVKIYMYDNKTGKYKPFAEEVIHTDINTSAKELFDKVAGKINFNKFFVMELESTIEEPFDDSISFYTVRTNKRGDVETINLIGPNIIDQEILIDAIMGCNPTPDFYLKYCNTDQIINKIITRPFCPSDKYCEEYYSWTSDARERLQKVNILRLREMYKNLRANQ